MNYLEAREYINKALKKGSILGLESIKRLMNELSNVQNEVKVLHIAGTNGKGSTLAYISEILKQAGYKVGKYTSPAVFDYREIFQINGEYISEEKYAFLMSKIKEAVHRIEKNGFESPTAFEIETALAYLYFYEEKCDFALVETGLGGDMDATNIVEDTFVSIITPISLDHTQFLGNTITEIATHKAGIIKENSSVVVAKQTNEATEVMIQYAMQNNAECVICNVPKNVKYETDKTIFDYVSVSGKKYENITTMMLGDFQPENIVTAIEVIENVIKKGYQVSEKAIYDGIKNAIWHGRFEKICDKPDIYFDGGHNPGAGEHIKKCVEIYFTNKRIVYIIGVLADKDYDSVLRLTGGYASDIITVTPNNARALLGEELKNTAKKYNDNVVSADTIDEAVKMAVSMVDNDDVIMIFGSLSYLNEAKLAVERRNSDDR